MFTSWGEWWSAVERWADEKKYLRLYRYATMKLCAAWRAEEENQKLFSQDAVQKREMTLQALHEDDDRENLRVLKMLLRYPTREARAAFMNTEMMMRERVRQSKRQVAIDEVQADIDTYKDQIEDCDERIRYIESHTLRAQSSRYTNNKTLYDTVNRGANKDMTTESSTQVAKGLLQERLAAMRQARGQSEVAKANALDPDAFFTRLDNAASQAAQGSKVDPFALRADTIYIARDKLPSGAAATAAVAAAGVGDAGDGVGEAAGDGAAVYALDAGGDGGRESRDDACLLGDTYY